MTPLKIGLVIANQELWGPVQACLKALPVRILLQQPVLGDAAVFLAQLEQLRLDVLLLDLTRLDEPFDQVIRRIKSCAAPPQVIVLNDTADAEIILGAIRAGANEFLYPPLETSLQKALERLSTERAKSQPEAARHRGRTLGFVSAKGGCGATTIACHVAVEIQKATTQEVLLADMDLEAGLVAFLMKAKTPYTILDAIHNVHRLDLSYWKALVSNGHAGLDVVTAPLPAATLGEMLDPEQFRNVLRFLRSSYDWIVTDLGRSLNAVSMHVLEELDEVFLVATLDMPALHQAKQVVQALMDAGYSRNRLKLILNRMPKRPDFEPGEVQRVLGLAIYETLPNDYPELFEAYAEGNLLTAGSELGRSLGALAGKIAGVQTGKDRSKQRLSLSIF